MRSCGKERGGCSPSVGGGGRRVHRGARRPGSTSWAGGCWYATATRSRGRCSPRRVRWRRSRRSQRKACRGGHGRAALARSQRTAPRRAHTRRRHVRARQARRTSRPPPHRGGLIKISHPEVLTITREHTCRHLARWRGHSQHKPARDVVQVGRQGLLDDLTGGFALAGVTGRLTDPRTAYAIATSAASPPPNTTPEQPP